MIIEPKVRGFVGLSAHPAGCQAAVQAQIDYVRRQGPSAGGPKQVLVIGASTGYGLASRIQATFGSDADTIGVFFERPGAAARPASAGWYNSAAFEAAAAKAGRGAWSINGDAFSNPIRQQTLQLIKDRLGKVDAVIYSLASPKRVDPDTGEEHRSVIKPLGGPFTGLSVDIKSGDLTEMTVEPATEDEVRHTTAVMGGADWRLWMRDLQAGGLLTPDAVTVAYSYIGPKLTWSIYRDGTIGRAKQDLTAAADELHSQLAGAGGGAYISVNKALITQASMAIPVVSLYLSLLYRVMKRRGNHEGCIEQIARLFSQRLYSGRPVPTDEQRRIRVDDWELSSEVQTEMDALWSQVTADNHRELGDIQGIQEDFFQLFGFSFPGVDYGQDVNPDVPIPSISASGST